MVLTVGDLHAVQFAECLIMRGDIEHTVSISIEGDFDLRDTVRGGRNTRELEPAERVVVLGAATFTFIHLNENARLVAGVNREYL